MADPLAWRQRLVEQVTYTDANTAIVSRSLQSVPLIDIITQAIGAVDRAVENIILFLPIGMLPKRALLRYSVSGPGGAPAHLPPKPTISGLMADSFVEAAYELGVIVDEELYNLLFAACSFTPQPYAQYSTLLPARGLRRYLKDAGISLQLDQVQQLRGRSIAAGKWLAAVARDRYDPFNSMHQPLLALAWQPPTDTSMSFADVDSLMIKYHAFIDQLRKRITPLEKPDAARRLLQRLSVSGSHWESIVECRVPLREPFMVKSIEEEPAAVGSLVGRLGRRHQFLEAGSQHLSLRVSDPAVEWGKKDLSRYMSTHDFEGVGIGIPVLESVRETREVLALYSANDQRPHSLTLRARLRVTSEVRRATWAVAGLSILSALVTLVLVRHARPLATSLAGDLAVLTLPTTLAASVLLTRERSSLAALLTAWSKRLTLFASTALWVVVFHHYLLIARGPHWVQQLTHWTRFLGR